MGPSGIGPRIGPYQRRAATPGTVGTRSTACDGCPGEKRESVLTIRNKQTSFEYNQLRQLTKTFQPGHVGTQTVSSVIALYSVLESVRLKRLRYARVLTPAQIGLVLQFKESKFAAVQWFPYIVAGAGAYLLGSIPTGYLVARSKGIDIRAHGSGNIGATNAFRVLGKRAGVFVLAVDALKGLVACGLIPVLVLQQWPGADAGRVAQRDYLAIVSGMAAILGHNFPCWLRFRGGKGIATSAGVLVALVPWALLIVFSMWGIVFWLTRYVSLGSVMAAVTLPGAVWLTTRSPRLTWAGVVFGALAIFKHRSNIQRLWNGTEHRVGEKRAEDSRNL